MLCIAKQSWAKRHPDQHCGLCCLSPEDGLTSCQSLGEEIPLYSSDWHQAPSLSIFLGWKSQLLRFHWLNSLMVKGWGTGVLWNVFSSTRMSASLVLFQWPQNHTHQLDF